MPHAPCARRQAQASSSDRACACVSSDKYQSGAEVANFCCFFSTFFVGSVSLLSGHDDCRMYACVNTVMRGSHSQATRTGEHNHVQSCIVGVCASRVACPPRARRGHCCRKEAREPGPLAALVRSFGFALSPASATVPVLAGCARRGPLRCDMEMSERLFCIGCFSGSASSAAASICPSKPPASFAWNTSRESAETHAALGGQRPAG